MDRDRRADSEVRPKHERDTPTDYQLSRKGAAKMLSPRMTPAEGGVDALIAGLEEIVVCHRKYRIEQVFFSTSCPIFNQPSLFFKEGLRDSCELHRQGQSLPETIAEFVFVFKQVGWILQPFNCR
jgi:hypothetical protein